MAKKRPMAFKHHEAIAAQLKETRQKIMDTLIHLQPYVTKQELERLRRAERHIDGFRCTMDSRLARQHPDRFSPKVYYGDQQERPSRRWEFGKGEREQAAEAIVTDAIRSGVPLYAKGEVVRYRAFSRMPPELARRIREHREDVLELLRELGMSTDQGTQP